MSLDCENLGYRVGERQLFQDLSANFVSGKLTGIIGPNGSGKSTLLSLLAGVRSKQTGEIICNGKAIASMSLSWRAQHLSYLPQQSHVYADLRVIDLVLLGRAPYRRLSPLCAKEDRQIAQASLDRVGLPSEKYSQRYLYSLSGGERQKTMLARMLATQTELFLLDEPTTALDIHNSLAFLELCRKLCTNERKKGCTIILSLHQIELAYRYCDFILLLGTPEPPYYLYGQTAKVATVKNISQVFQVKVSKIKQNIFFHHYKT